MGYALGCGGLRRTRVPRFATWPRSRRSSMHAAGYAELAAHLPAGFEAQLCPPAEDPAPAGRDAVSSGPIIQMVLMMSFRALPLVCGKAWSSWAQALVVKQEHSERKPAPLRPGQAQSAARQPPCRPDSVHPSVLGTRHRQPAATQSLRPEGAKARTPIPAPHFAAQNGTQCMRKHNPEPSVKRAEYPA